MEERNEEEKGLKIIVALIIAYAMIEIFLCGADDKSRTEMEEAEQEEYLRKWKERKESKEKQKDNEI